MKRAQKSGGQPRFRLLVSGEQSSNLNEVSFSSTACGSRSQLAFGTPAMHREQTKSYLSQDSMSINAFIYQFIYQFY